LPDVSAVCKMPANYRVSASTLFLAFQEIYPDCCTVAAQDRKNARGEWPPVLELQRRESHRAAHNYAGPRILPYRVSWSRNAS
jgi:hypothetical protein